MSKLKTRQRIIASGQFTLSKDNKAVTSSYAACRSADSGKFIVRADEEVKRSRVSAYRYLVP